MNSSTFSVHVCLLFRLISAFHLHYVILALFYGFLTKVLMVLMTACGHLNLLPFYVWQRVQFERPVPLTGSPSKRITAHAENRKRIAHWTLRSPKARVVTCKLWSFGSVTYFYSHC